MAKFVRNKAVVVDTPQVAVEPAAGDKLDLGANRFQLTVIDDAGNESAPVMIDIIVRDGQKPTAVLDLVDGNGTRLDNLVVKEGQKIILSGARSTDKAPGKIEKYSFTWIQRG